MPDTPPAEEPSRAAALDLGERRYRLLAEQLPGVAYVEALQAASAMYISPRIEDLTGYSAEEWAGDPNFFESVLHPQDHTRVMDLFARAHMTFEPVVCEYRILRRDGTYVWVHDDARVAFDDDGAPLFVQGYMTDITERKAVEAERERVLALERDQNERLRELDVMKDEFVALVSHELRTPLTAIQGYLEMVVDGSAGELNEEQIRMLAAVSRNSDRLLSIINDLLFLAQVNSGQLDVEFVDVDIAAVAAESVADAQPRAQAGGIDLRFECDLTPTVRADRVRLAQVFDNLISNAIKFTPPGGNVGLSVSMVGDEAIIVVADSGMGMSPEDQQRLFTRFFRTKTAASIQGTGLGLSITKAILDAHRGSISVESAEGEGTRFTVTVPAS